jgi:hypothetical protein
MLPIKKQSPNVCKKIPRILFLKFGDFIFTFAFWLNFAQTKTLEPTPKSLLFYL